MCKVVGYVRVSTGIQAKEGFSLEQQREEIESFCEAQGYQLLRIYEDAGLSGAKCDEDELVVDRPGIQDMLADIRYDGGVKYVVTLTTSRLWRSDIAKVLIHRELRRAGVDVRAIDRPTYSIYDSDPSAKLINGMLELLDEYERLEIALKLKRGRMQKAKRGGYAGGGAPMGYKAERDSKRLTVNEEQVPTIRRVFELREQHPGATLRELAELLNSEGLTTARGARWQCMQVKRVLDRQEFYSGQYSYAGITSEGKHTPILE